MRKVLYFILCLFLCSCSEVMPGNGCFVVVSVQENSDFTKYHIVQTKGIGGTFFNEKVGLYHVGDTLCL